MHEFEEDEETGGLVHATLGAAASASRDATCARVWTRIRARPAENHPRDPPRDLSEREDGRAREGRPGAVARRPRSAPAPSPEICLVSGRGVGGGEGRGGGCYSARHARGGAKIVGSEVGTSGAVRDARAQRPTDGRRDGSKETHRSHRHHAGKSGLVSYVSSSPEGRRHPHAVAIVSSVRSSSSDPTSAAVGVVANAVSLRRGGPIPTFVDMTRGPAAAKVARARRAAAR